MVLTTDRPRRRGTLDLAKTSSPGSLASSILSRFGVVAPLEKFDLDETEYEHWAETFHGGRVQADPRLLGRPFTSVSLDVASCFPLIAYHLGWWEILCASELAREDVTDDLHDLCRRVDTEPLAAIDPTAVRRFGMTLVEGVHAEGEILPVEVEDELRPDGRLEFVPVRSRQRPLNFTALSILASSVESRRVPPFERATRYVPLGRQGGLRTSLPLLPGLTLKASEDPALDMVQHRRRVESAGEEGLAAVLRVVVNALVFGNLARFDNKVVREGHRWQRVQVPGPYNFLPLASCISSGAHLLLAVLARLVEERGGLVAYMDTDSAVIPSSKGGTPLLLAEGPSARALTTLEISLITNTLEVLSPAPWWKVWRVEGLEERP